MATIESWIWTNGKIISHEIKELKGEWKSEKDDPVFQSMQKNIGIGFINPAYIEVTEIQDKDYEYSKIEKFLYKYMQEYAKKNNLSITDLKLQFINYGRTELVYVLTDTNQNRVTLLVKQPAVKTGKVKEEAENLKYLKQKWENVVAPIDYFELGDQELYVTPYINQARCIASYGTWGMYVPEPYYRFESFSREQEKIVNTCMIAKLISLYNFPSSEGICSCKLGGGDFMLEKGWETEQLTIENTLSKMYLIAARDKVVCSFEEYIEIIRKEFSIETISEDPSNLVINIRGRVPMKLEDIEEGIKLGKSMIECQRVLNSTINDKFQYNRIQSIINRINKSPEHKITASFDYLDDIDKLLSLDIKVVPIRIAVNLKNISWDLARSFKNSEYPILKKIYRVKKTGYIQYRTFGDYSDENTEVLKKYSIPYKIIKYIVYKD